jgi:hypothetical protein
MNYPEELLFLLQLTGSLLAHEQTATTAERGSPSLRLYMCVPGVSGESMRVMHDSKALSEEPNMIAELFEFNSHALCVNQ